METHNTSGLSGRGFLVGLGERLAAAVANSGGVAVSRPAIEAVQESVCVAGLARLARGSVQEAESRGRSGQSRGEQSRVANCEVRSQAFLDCGYARPNRYNMARRQAVFSRKSASIGCSMNAVGPASLPSQLWPAFSIDATRERTMHP